MDILAYIQVSGTGTRVPEHIDRTFVSQIVRTHPSPPTLNLDSNVRVYMPDTYISPWCSWVATCSFRGFIYLNYFRVRRVHG